MKNEYIEELYEQCNVPVEYIKICPLMRWNNRGLIYVHSIKFVTEPTETFINRTFYQSTGISRGDITTRGIWFPVSDKGFESDITRKIVLRLGKLEDQILSSIESGYKYDFNADYNIYCRFVNKNNTYTDDFVMTLTDHTNSSYPEVLTLYENKVCANPMIINL